MSLSRMKSRMYQELGMSINIEKSPDIPLPVYSSNTIDNQVERAYKKIKTNHYPTEEIRSVESNVQQSFVLAPISQNRHGQPVNIDVENPIFKLPFEHGWRREVVFRKLMNSNAKKQLKPFGDVYYYTPTNKKLRSVRAIQTFLNQVETEDNILSIDNFTFAKAATGINNSSKEVIREAQKSLKDNKLNKSKNVNKVSPNNSKNIRKRKSQSNKNNKSMNISSTLMDTYSTSMNTSSASSTSSSQTAKKNINNNIRNLEKRKSLRKQSDPPMITMQSHSDMLLALKHVFKQLNVFELLTASEVCTAWNIIAMNNTYWQNVCLKNVKVNNWEKCISTVDLKRSFALDTSHMFIPKEINENKKFWFCFAKAIKNAKNIKTIGLYECPIHIVEDVMYSLPQLEVFKATIINNEFKYNRNESITLDYLKQMKQLTEVKLKGPDARMKLMQTPSLSNLTNLKILSLTSIQSFPKDIYSSLLNLKKHLEVLEIGNCDSLSEDFPSVIEKLEKLTSLRLENCNGNWNSHGKYYFRAIRRLNNLRTLELINIKFSFSIEYELERCDHIKALLIIPDYENQSSAINLHLFYFLKKLSKTLSYLAWGITNETLDDDMDEFNSYIKNLYKSYILKLSIEEIPSHDFNILKVRGLEVLLKNLFANVKTKLIKIPFSKTTEVYLANEFNEIGLIK